MKQQHDICSKFSLKGRLRISKEGLNGTLDGYLLNLNEYMRIMDEFVGVGKIDWKLSCYPNSCSNRFSSLSIKETKEVVSLDLDDDTKKSLQLAGVGKHLSPHEFHNELLHATDDLALIDVRNFYETRIGRFEYSIPVSSNDSSTISTSSEMSSVANAFPTMENSDAGTPATCLNDDVNHSPPKVGALRVTAIDPMTRVFSDFKMFVDKNVQLLKRKKKILMYCTGGVRCETASAYMKIKGLEACQLSGGIQRYQEVFGDTGFFKGKNFVFDPRGAVGNWEAANSKIETTIRTSEHPQPQPINEIALPTDSSCASMTSFKSSIQRDTSSDANASSTHSSHSCQEFVIGRCMICSSPHDSYENPSRCSVCRALVLVCEACKCFHNSSNFHLKTAIQCELCIARTVDDRYQA
jgi:predicted sulfurtransferase